ncbi:MAG: fructose-bisphosphatase class II family protein, partial [Proteobacteria bacterium]
PLEGTTICANGGYNSISVIAIAEEGNFLHAPDTYMDKIAVGPAAANAIDLAASPTENLKEIGKALKKSVESLTVVILDRPRHADLIAEVRRSGARIQLIGDGDVSAAIAAAMENSGVDVLMGTGGAPEGVIAAAAIRCIGGNMMGRLKFRNQSEIDRAGRMGIKDVHRIWTLEEMAKGNVMFCATGVTKGSFLDGVRFTPGGAETHSIVMRSETGTVRDIRATHRFDLKPRY